MAKRAAGREDDGDMLPLEQRRQLYAARRYLSRASHDKLGLRVKVEVYFKDPRVAQDFPGVGLDAGFTVPWEPGLGDGPTSARFAVVDYDATTGTLAQPAGWDAKANGYRWPEPADPKAPKPPPQFRQVNAWAILQNTLEHFESGFGLGRRIPWGFEGNRLIVVPNAGYGENAYYDRKSKSLQFYYFDGEEGKRVYTCLSSDILNHELGHALLDGIRPWYFEAVSPETAAFHEFIGDLTALMMAFRNNRFRQAIAERTGGELAGDALVAGIAHEFGLAVAQSDYLRSGANDRTMSDVAGSLKPHDMSEVLTGALFDILLKLSVRYREREGNSVDEAFWYTIQRLQPMALQALDLLPPVEVTFRDFALAMLRAEFVANPTDPDRYRAILLEVFVTRGILSADDAAALQRADHVFNRLDLAIFHDVRDISASRTAAYRFLDDNRRSLFIPPNADLVVQEPLIAEKLNREGRRLPKQTIVQYLWREDVALTGERFGRYAGRHTGILCGGTLVLDADGNMVAWMRKPGVQRVGTGAKALQEARLGAERRALFLEQLARRIAAGMVGEALGGEAGLLADSVPLLDARSQDGAIRFELTPHLALGHAHENEAGGMPWRISS